MRSWRNTDAEQYLRKSCSSPEDDERLSRLVPEVSESYWLGLNDLTDHVGKRMAREVLRKFDDRPSVKALREWANTLAAPVPSISAALTRRSRPLCASPGRTRSRWAKSSPAAGPGCCPRSVQPPAPHSD